MYMKRGDIDMSETKDRKPAFKLKEDYHSNIGETNTLTSQYAESTRGQASAYVMTHKKKKSAQIAKNILSAILVAALLSVAVYYFYNLYRYHHNKPSYGQDYLYNTWIADDGRVYSLKEDSSVIKEAGGITTIGSFSVENARTLIMEFPEKTESYQFRINEETGAMTWTRYINDVPMKTTLVVKPDAGD